MDKLYTMELEQIVSPQIEAFNDFRKCLRLPQDSKEGVACRLNFFSIYKNLIQTKIDQGDKDRSR